MRAEPAPWPPSTARNALVMATEIFAGSKPTTAPLRRISLYWENGDGCAPAASGKFVVGIDWEVVASAAICMCGILVAFGYAAGSCRRRYGIRRGTFTPT